VQNPKPDTVVAVKTASGWAALYASDAESRQTFAVERLQAQPSAAQRKTVAVLDPDEAFARSICMHLQDAGYEAPAFQRMEDLQATVATGNYDAFILDWTAGEPGTAQLIASIRARDSACPIVVLASGVDTDQVRESEIADALTKFDLLFSQKPVRLAILSAMLARAFSVR
jgi:DNA-binding NtrC family response regulator